MHLRAGFAQVLITVSHAPQSALWGQCTGSWQMEQRLLGSALLKAWQFPLKGQKLKNEAFTRNSP